MRRKLLLIIFFTSVSVFPGNTKQKPERAVAIFAGGCFWGIEYFMELEPGVISVISGYTGGTKRLPNYRDVSSGKSGHAEAVKVVYDPAKVSYERLARKFFEIHDPTQDIRQSKSQYRSAIFYLSLKQKAIAEKLIAELKKNGYHVKTELDKATTFWRAETGHQNYYSRQGVSPRCHNYKKRFSTR